MTRWCGPDENHEYDERTHGAHGRGGRRDRGDAAARQATGHYLAKDGRGPHGVDSICCQKHNMR